MNVNDDGICQRCRKPGNENLFTQQNRLDPGLSIQQLVVIYDLPVPDPLSQIEEMMLSPVQATTSYGILQVSLINYLDYQNTWILSSFIQSQMTWLQNRLYHVS
jgi:alpha-D-ribose 1-methylphosphonate 5-phosphate C-P lyase